MELIDDQIDFSIYLHETNHQTKVRPASEWIADLKTRLRGQANRKKVLLPWDKARENFEFRQGEVSVWSGQNGHGKSRLTSQIALSLMGQGERLCIANFESKPVTTMQRMGRMFAGTNPFSPEYQGDDGIEAIDALYDDFGVWTDGKLWLYDQMGTADAGTVLGMVRYCAKELGITHIMVDNLAKCVKGEDDYNGQKEFVDELCAIAKDYSVHCHLIHHLKKPANENAMPDKHDNKGSGSITDQPDNIWLIWRNKAKEEAAKQSGFNSKKREEPDQLLMCRKQRNFDGSGEGEPTIKLWFNRDAGQFVADAGAGPLQFKSFPHRSGVPESSHVDY
mgnify:FL=1